MPDGTGLKKFGEKFPDRFFDVGIAEAHAVTSAAGMAAGGLKPVVAVYSSFLQRGFDQILHDVCIQNLPVVFAVDRAGLVGSDGETHQGIFDLSFLTMIPNMTVMAPKNRWELEDMISFAVDYDGPIAVRYPRGEAYDGLKEFRSPVSYGKGEMLFEEQEIALLAAGSMVSTGEHVREKLKAAGHSCSLGKPAVCKAHRYGTFGQTGKKSQDDCNNGRECSPGRIRSGSSGIYEQPLSGNKSGKYCPSRRIRRAWKCIASSIRTRD